MTLDRQEPKTGPKKRLDRVLDFACGSGSLLLNVRNRTKKAGGKIGKIYGQEKNITTYNHDFSFNKAVGIELANDSLPKVNMERILALVRVYRGKLIF